MDKYLNVTKSVIISSPAGSGKTEKLARRYISLLLDGSEIEKILCITFTEKAAAEMKERILNILEKENHELFLNIKEKMPLMRISTIHSFCLKLLKRFSIELGLDPSLDVMDEFEASLLWSESVYECLMQEKDKPDLFFEMMTARGVKGWNSIHSTLNNLYEKRPLSELLLKTIDSIEGEQKKILELYSRCIKRYTSKKHERQLLDFSDLELLAYDALVKHPEWQNILYSFDEHTDHILVDEFQDTSTLQWRIIDKLTEEWRSGMGAKRVAGKTPTIFLVGDDKQSIYLFRDANSEIFHEAKKRLSEWLGEEYYFEEVKENYRSLPAIINFTNSLFSRLMPAGLVETWRTKYSAFEGTRQGKGLVELVLLEPEDNTKKNRVKEANALAKRIRSLAGFHKIFDGEVERPCIFGDMAILLRQRTHLAVFENALRNEQIPFVVAKGIGFYDEPEVAILRELLCFIIDPLDDYSLFCVLRSPLFNIDYEVLLSLVDRNSQPLFEKVQEHIELHSVYKILSNWTEKSKTISFSMVIEDALTETEAWSYYWESQRQANIKKFLRVIESYESKGFSSLEIREKLIKARSKDEPKANVNTEGMNAVKIMTIHAAKGLQFPMVFLPSLDEADRPRSGNIVIEEDDGRISMAYEEDSYKRRKIPEFEKRKEKELEEGKRLFYVAVTRARDFLCMLGSFDKEKPKGRLTYILDSFDVIKNGVIKKTDLFEILTESDIDRIYFEKHTVPIPPYLTQKPASGPIYTEPISYEPDIRWRDVTEDIDIRIKHGDDWVLLGKIMHRIFEELSKGILKQERITERTLLLLKMEAVPENNINKFTKIISEELQKLETGGYLKDIILPQQNAYAELPFVLQKGKTVFRGRIDRIIINNNTAIIYDYKTFPVKDRELTELVEKYRFQMEIYKEAAEKILSMKAKGYLFFTYKTLLVEV